MRIIDAGSVSDQGGFTLLEVMMAAVIFAVGILAVGAMQLGAIKTNTSAEMITDAYTQASMEIENRLEDAWNASIPINFSRSQPPYTIATVVDLNSTDTQVIQVTVSWQHRGGNRHITLNHLRSRASM